MENNKKSSGCLPAMRYENGRSLPLDVECPDPFVLRFDGMYYLYFTCGGKQMYCYQSENLIDFSMVDNGVLPHGVIYDYDADENHPDSLTPFAPEVCYYDGTFYMIASPSGNGHYLFASDSPKGPFRSVSKNLGRKIDGSFFLDGDEKVYLYGAFDDALKVYSLSEDFSNIEEEAFLSPAHLGRWNEGPYMLRRYGRYYLTYCGAHFLSTDYRVDYCSGKAPFNPLFPLCYKREKTILISTEKDFYGLGHSCTVLGPDLDSYFLVYHNLLDDRRRFLNLSRLSFSGEKMGVNGARLHDVPFVPQAYRAKDGDELVDIGDAYVLDLYSEETFSVEFNNIGTGRMVFSYLDNNHYGFLDFDGKQLVLGKKEFEEEILTTIPLSHTYRTDVLHSFLLQYRRGYLALYFDHMEKLYAFPCSYRAGKVGYLKKYTFLTIGSTSLSAFALGSSEEKYPKDSLLFANGYDPEQSKNVSPTTPYLHLGLDSRVSYAIDIPEDGDYLVLMTLRRGYQGKRLSIEKEGAISFPVYLEEEETGKEESEVLLSSIPFKKGAQYLTFVGEEDLYFSQIRLVKKEEALEVQLDFTREQNEKSFFFRESPTRKEDGYHLEDEGSSALLYEKKTSSDEVALTFLPETIEEDGMFCLLFEASEFCNNFVEDGDGKDNPTSYRGFSLSLTKNTVQLSRVDFNYTEALASKPYSYKDGAEVTLSLRRIKNRLEGSIDGEQIFSLPVSLGNREGKAGFLTYHAKAVLKALSIRNRKEENESIFFH